MCSWAFLRKYKYFGIYARAQVQSGRYHTYLYSTYENKKRVYWYLSRAGDGSTELYDFA
jgi:hypothetical protein